SSAPSRRTFEPCSPTRPPSQPPAPCAERGARLDRAAHGDAEAREVVADEARHPRLERLTGVQEAPRGLLLRVAGGARPGTGDGRDARGVRRRRGVVAVRWLLAPGPLDRGVE